MTLSSGQHEVIGMVLLLLTPTPQSYLQNQPHSIHIVASMAPVTNGVQVSEVEAVLHAQLNADDSTRDLASDKSGASTRGFVIEENTVRQEHAVGFTIVYNDPVSELLRNTVRRTRVERSLLVLGNGLDLSVQFGSGSLVEASLLLESTCTDSIEQTEGTDAVHLSTVLGKVERHLDVALSSQVVNLIRLDLSHQSAQVGGISEISIVKEETDTLVVRILVKMVDSSRVERRRTSNNSVHFIALAMTEQLKWVP